LTVRPATPADIGPLDAMFARSYGPLLRADYPPSLLVVALPRIARAQPALLASGHYFVAELDGELVGAGGWSLGTPGGPGEGGPGLGHVRHVATRASVARRGVGRAILERVFDDARSAGVSRLACLSTLTAVPFYEALGFQAGRRRDLAFVPGLPFPAVEMTRDL
jgi:GNAT superfamily N-acetyltransferase